MKRGILSIIVALVGFYFVYRFNIQVYRGSVKSIEESNSTFLIEHIFSFIKVYKIVSICIALLSIYLGIISWKKNKSKIGLTGIILAIILIIITFIPFSEYLLENYLSNKNITN